jgi:hypothetical protein
MSPDHHRESVAHLDEISVGVTQVDEPNRSHRTLALAGPRDDFDPAFAQPIDQGLYGIPGEQAETLDFTTGRSKHAVTCQSKHRLSDRFTLSIWGMTGTRRQVSPTRVSISFA